MPWTGERRAAKGPNRQGLNPAAVLSGAAAEARQVPGRGVIAPGVSLPAAFDGSAGRFAEDSRASLFESPLEAIDARAGLIMNVRKSVTAGYFAFSPDAAGLAKLALLRDAARRGVSVRLALDHWGNKLPKALLRDGSRAVDGPRGLRCRSRGAADGGLRRADMERSRGGRVQGS